MRLQAKVAIVTGASSGIGRAIALKFAEEGAKVTVADIREDPRGDGKPTHEMIQERGGEAIFLETDVSSEKSVQDMVYKTAKKFGKIDVLVNNAGIYEQKTLTEMPKEDWDKVIGVDLDGVYLCSKEVISHMLKEGIEGSIINISSLAGLVGWGGSPAYCAAKGAVSNLTRELSLDYAKEGININAICPGVIKTQMTKMFREDPEMKKMMEGNTPYYRLGEPEDIANAALFLASDESNFVNGENLVVDGGWTAH